MVKSAQGRERRRNWTPEKKERDEERQKVRLEELKRYDLGEKTKENARTRGQIISKGKCNEKSVGTTDERRQEMRVGISRGREKKWRKQG